MPTDYRKRLADLSAPKNTIPPPPRPSGAGALPLPSGTSLGKAARNFLLGIVEAPRREYLLIALVTFGLGYFTVTDGDGIPLLLTLSVLGALPTALVALVDALRFRLTIEVFNTFALIVSLATGEITSAGFIVLMLAFARLLDWRTENRTRHAVEALMKLKPATAFREEGLRIVEIPIGDVRQGDTIIVKTGARVPVDGTVIYGRALMNESAITGESKFVKKIIGDDLVAGTVNELGMVKIRATHVGGETTIDRMVALMHDAAKHKSMPERQADTFARIFLPIVAIIGLALWFITKNLSMTAAFFLVACADDMAVAIPLAVTAAIGQAARRGMIVKGGLWFDIAAKAATVVFDKTGTLTYGQLVVRETVLAPGVNEEEFYQLLAAAEKFSEHPVGKAVYRLAAKRLPNVADPQEFRTKTGNGVWARIEDREIAVGNEALLDEYHFPIPAEANRKLADAKDNGRDGEDTVIFVAIDRHYAGFLVVSDSPRPEAQKAVQELRRLGVRRIAMFTGDEPGTAATIARTLGIADVRAEMTPEKKLREIESLSAEGPLVMVGDGVNDAPALARADIGVAMGQEGTAAAVEAADVVILTDDLGRLPELVTLSRRLRSVIHWDMGIWVGTNLFGFALVFAGVMGPAFAAFYNFATDFLPVANSVRLFRKLNIEAPQK